MKKRKVIMAAMIMIFGVSTIVAVAGMNGRSFERVAKSETLSEIELEESAVEDLIAAELIQEEETLECDLEESTVATPSQGTETMEMVKTMDASEDFEIVDKVLVKYHGKEEVVIVPEGVEAIGEGAFKGNSYVREIILPDSAICAYSEAFAYMEHLTRIENGLGFYTDYIDIYDGSDKIEIFDVRSGNQ